MDEQCLYSFPVDLQKEELVQLTYLQGHRFNPKRQRKMFLIVSLLCLIPVVGMLVEEWMVRRVIDPLLAVSSVLMLIPMLYAFAILPWLLRRRAEKAYDQSLAAGRDFFGEVQLYHDRVEKKTADLTAKIPLNGHTMFVETPDLMAFVNRFSPAIILPARCMTEESAKAVRTAADHLPFTNRRFLGRLQPQAQPVTIPGEKQAPQVLWECEFVYSDEELIASARRMMLTRFWMRAPLLVLLSLFPAFSVGMDGSLPSAIGSCLFFLGLLVVLNLVLPMSNLKRSVVTVTPAQRTRRVTVDTMGVRLNSPESGDSLLLWTEDLHVYDKAPFAEFAVKKRTAFYLPKRCIDNVDGFNEVIRRCRGKQ